MGLQSRQTEIKYRKLEINIYKYSFSFFIKSINFDIFFYFQFIKISSSVKIMHQSHQETQSQFHSFEMQDGDILKKSIPIKSRFAQETGSEQSNNSALMKCSMKLVQTKKRDSTNNEILRESTNLTENTEGNVVRVKPKNRPSSVLACEKNNQNSVQPLQIQSKAKKPTHIKKLSSQDQEQNCIIKNFATSKIILHPRIFLIKPVPQNEVTRCKILRQSSCLSHQLQFFLERQKKHLINFQRQFYLMKNKINIKIPLSSVQKSQHSADMFSEKPMDPDIGWMESNFKGSLFNVYEMDETNKHSQIVATIQYFTDVGKTGGPRRIKLYLRDRTMTTYIGNLRQNQNLKDFHEKNPVDSTIQCLQTLAPTYNHQKDMYTVNINGKSKSKASIHNIVLINNQLKPVLKFYKTQQKVYQLECYHPMTPLIGTAFAYSSFIFKWASQ